MCKFKSGKFMQTKAIAETFKANSRFANELVTAIKRYLDGDWGDLTPEDKAMNDRAATIGNDRIHATYHTCKGKVYIITEADRFYTTVLFAEEY